MLPAQFFTTRDLGRSLLFTHPLDRIEKAFTRELAIERLGSRVLDGHADSSRPVTQSYGG